ncbi:hypothetical protein ACFL6I_22880 [candidate division KSB1 bacterium]
MAFPAEMTVKFLKKKYVLSFLLIIIFAASSYAQSNGIFSADAEQNTSLYHFVFFKDDTPYVCIEYPPIVENAKRFLSPDSVFVPPIENAAIIDTTHETVGIELPISLRPFDFRFELPVYEFHGDNDVLKAVFGYAPGDSLVIQQALYPGLGSQAVTIVENVFFHMSRSRDRYYTYLLLKCAPISISVVPARVRFHELIAAYRYNTWDNELYREPFDLTVPSFVTDTLQKIEDEFIPEFWKTPPLNDPVLMEDFRHGILHYSTTVTPMRIVTPEDEEKIFYAGVVSYGLKGNRSHLFLIDEHGNFIQDIEIADEGSGRGYNRILGITDVNRDGTHELATFWGDAYGGGLALLTIEFQTPGIPYLVQKLKILTTGG